MGKAAPSGGGAGANEAAGDAMGCRAAREGAGRGGGGGGDGGTAKPEPRTGTGAGATTPWGALGRENCAGGGGGGAPDVSGGRRVSIFGRIKGGGMDPSGTVPHDAVRLSEGATGIDPDPCWFEGGGRLDALPSKNGSSSAMEPSVRGCE